MESLFDFGPVTQLAEYPALNRKVVGSTPTGSTKFYDPIHVTYGSYGVDGIERLLR